MKKLFTLIIFIYFALLPVNAVDLNDYWQIRLVLKDYESALKKQDINKIKDFYAENYRDSDGFTLEESAQMFEKMYNAYDKVSQKTKINSITSFDNYVIVQLTDTTNAVVNPQKDTPKKNNKGKSISQIIRENRILKERQGKLESKSIYSLYFKKIDNKWKIFYDDISAETTSLKYGVAKDVKMELDAPAFVNDGESYNLSLKINKSNDLFAVASLSNEEILFPTPETEEKFRKVPQEGELERIVKANHNKKNECAIASVGFTEVSVNEAQTKARIEVVGMALLMKRVNMLNSKDNNEK